MLYNLKNLAPAQLRSAQQDVTAGSGTVSARLKSGTLFVTNSGASTVDVELSAPTAGDTLLIVCLVGSGNPTVTLPTGCTFDGTNRRAVLANGRALYVYAVSSTRFFVMVNVGTVTFTNP